MKPARAPRFETRRAKELEAELFERARAWIPSWGMDDDERDFGRALLKIAARFGSEVAERLDRAGEKLRLGFLDWLAVPTEAARPARLPVVFKLADSARDAVPATASTRLQVEAAGASVILETEKDVLVLPRQLQVLVAVDADADAFFLPPPGLSSLAPLEPLPTQWQLKSFASTGATQLQLDPEQGLGVDRLIELGGQQYRIAQVNRDIVTVDPPLTQDQPEQSIATLVTSFMPFDGAARNRQQHALYLGHKELFDIESAAAIEIAGAKKLAGVAWHYWGKKHLADDVGWQALPLASAGEQAKSDAIVLAKPPGSMEMLELVKGTQSRWIRASAGSLALGDPPLLALSDPPLRVDGFGIRINCRHGAPPPEPGTGAAAAAASAEAMANTTPLVLDNVFFPFGKEPRQFDAFYLGSKEAFSKKGAEVVLDFKMADTTFSALSAVRGGTFAGTVLAGVAEDGALHMLEVNALTGAIGKFREREPLRPRSSEGMDATPGLALDQRPRGRLPIWQDTVDANGFLVATTASDAVWVWRERSDDQNASKWISFGAVPTRAASPNALISDLVYLADTSMLVALRGGQMSVRQWPSGPQWTPVETRDGPAPVVLEAIVPILTGAALESSTVAGMIGVSSDRRLYAVSSAGVCTGLPLADVNADVRPVAVLRDMALIIALAHTSPRDLVMYHSDHGEKPIELEEPAAVTGFEAVLGGGGLYFLAGVQLPGGGYLASWAPHAGPLAEIELFRSDIPPGTGVPDGAPVSIAGHVVIPGSGGDLIATGFDLAGRRTLTSPVGQGIVTPASAPLLQPNDTVALDDATAPPFEARLVSESGTASQGEVFYPLDQPFSDGKAGALYAFRAADATFSGDAVQADQTLELDDGDHVTFQDSLVQIGDVVHRVTQVQPTFPGRRATLDPGHDADATVTYRVAVPVSGRAAPFVRLNATNNDWDPAVLEHATLVFPHPADPRSQTARAFSLDSAQHPLLVVMGKAWTVAPAPAAPFVLDGAAGPWTRSLGDTSTNPELSWEYWNGTGWWKLAVKRDGTLHLKISGALTFDVPLDLAPTDWSGRTNYWIRARLIGGDYGREKVSVATSPPDNDGVTHQTIERSTRDIHAPSVVKLGISYEICESVPPTFVLTKDSGSLRDQSDANRTAGAKVETFLPLAVLLGRLSGPPAEASIDEDCKPDCDCPSGVTSASAPAATSASSPPATSSASAAATGRAVYLGFDAPLLGEPINVLLLVEERPHDAFAPMTVEALIADRFVPIVIDDATRALGESGVLSLAFPVEPTPRELFGQTLRWLRLTPAAARSASADWNPKVLGAYLNGVWASAAETLTRELVGSSQGEPNLTLYLARPPVLRDTLELRVKEPLGEEERGALNAERADQVLSAVDKLPGDWVLWKRVIDPADEAPAARVYSLDEATGEIRFGDGRHGRIPPVGRDSIVAFTYRRTEAGASDSTVVPGNAITARTPLNLVSPIEGVEAVFAAAHAAGGAPPEDTGRVLRFGVASLRHRERALTTGDVEDIVLESSPDIAQARCFRRNGSVQLVVVMRGADPMPSAAQVRELQRLLLSEAPPSLGARQALRIVGPTLRRLRVELRLRVASLDDAGAVAREARKRISALFDTATGGPDANGWGLGENPGEGDVAAALADVPRLKGIAAVALREIAAGDGDRPWPQTLKRTELARLDQDDVRIEFEQVEVVA